MHHCLLCFAISFSLILMVSSSLYSISFNSFILLSQVQRNLLGIFCSNGIIVPDARAMHKVNLFIFRSFYEAYSLNLIMEFVIYQMQIHFDNTLWIGLCRIIAATKKATFFIGWENTWILMKCFNLLTIKLTIANTQCSISCIAFIRICLQMQCCGLLHSLFFTWFFYPIIFTFNWIMLMLLLNGNNTWWIRYIRLNKFSSSQLYCMVVLEKLFERYHYH